MKFNLLKKVIAVSKFILYMAVLQTTFASLAIANNGFGQNLAKIQVSCDWKNSQLADAFTDIQLQTDLFFTYTYETIEDIRISTQNQDYTVIDILKFISGETGLQFKIFGDIIYVFEGNYNLKDKIKIEIPKIETLTQLLELNSHSVIYESHILNPTDKIIKGIVTSEDGEPLLGATVQVKTTGQGTSTDKDGLFSVAVPNEGEVILLVSYIGYKPREVVVKDEDNIKITLKRNTSELNEILVTGYRLSNQKAIKEKRESRQTKDVISSNEIGNLPDFNAGEAIRRLPGINIVNDQAEAREIVIRGFGSSYYNTNVDGVQAPSTNGVNRSVEMDVYSSSLLSRIEVVKSFTPDIDGNATGGQVNLITRSPFESERQFLSAGGSIGLYSNNKGYNGNSSPSGTLDLLYSNRFGSKKEFGFLISGNYYRRDSYQPRLESNNDIWWFDPGSNERVDAYSDGAFPFPRARRWLYYDNLRQRYGANVKLEYQPSEKFKLRFGYIYQLGLDTETRMDNEVDLDRNEVTKVSATSLDFTSEENTVQMGRFDFNRNVNFFNSSFDLKTSTKGLINFLASYSKAHYEQPQVWDNFQYKDIPGSYTIGLDNNTFDFNPTDPSDYGNPSNYKLDKREINDQYSDENLFQTKIDYGLNAEPNDNGLGFKVGAKITTLDREFNFERDRLKRGDSPDDFYSLADVIVTDNTDYKGPIGGDNREYIAIDADKVDAFVEANEYNEAIFSFSEENSTDNSRDYSAKETITAGYAMGTYKNEKIHGWLGARYERTDFESAGKQRVRDGEIDEYQDGSNEGDYGNFLPSVGLIFNVTDNILLRASFGKTISRPNFTDYAVRGENIDDRDPDLLKISRSNPDLKPRIADNIDFSTEWYFDGNDGIISLGLFYKSIQDEIFKVTSEEQLEYNGQTRLAEISQPVNISDVKVSGLEFGLTKTFTFLPKPFDRFGTTQNFTLLNPNYSIITNDGSERELENLVGQTNFNYNGILFYEGNKISGRIALNYSDAYLSNFRTNTDYRDRYISGRTQLDVRLAYKLNSAFSVYVSGWNITGTPREYTIGRDQEFFAQFRDWGSAWFVGFNYALK